MFDVVPTDGKSHTAVLVRVQAAAAQQHSSIKNATAPSVTKNIRLLCDWMSGFSARQRHHTQHKGNINTTQPTAQKRLRTHSGLGTIMTRLLIALPGRPGAARALAWSENGATKPWVATANNRELRHPKLAVTEPATMFSASVFPAEAFQQSRLQRKAQGVPASVRGSPSRP